MGAFGVLGLGLWVITLLGIWPFTSTQNITFLPSNSPLEKGNNSLVVMVDSLEFTDTIKGLDNIFSGPKTFKSGQGTFLIIYTNLTNLTDHEVCLHGQDFTISYNNQISPMPRNILRIASSHYKRAYPDFYWGQCLKSNEQSQIFLVFDIPTSGQLTLQVAQQQVSLGEIAELRKTFTSQ